MSGGCSSAPLQEKYALKLRFRSFERAVPPLQPKETLQIEQRPTVLLYPHDIPIILPSTHPSSIPQPWHPEEALHVSNHIFLRWRVHRDWPSHVGQWPSSVIPMGWTSKSPMEIIKISPGGFFPPTHKVFPPTHKVSRCLLPQKSPGLVVPHRLLVEASFQLHRGHAHHGVQRPARGPPEARACARRFTTSSNLLRFQFHGKNRKKWDLSSYNDGLKFL